MKSYMNYEMMRMIGENDTSSENDCQTSFQIISAQQQLVNCITKH